uniref:Uncharacterized protein n=1 Tax=Neogobius melanostomus TaxID=47308 RepID=A0A8C6T042_9GOBI
MLFLFQGQEQTFMTEFSKREPDMRLLLQELEACADKLYKMCRASHIEGTVNSSVGLTSGILSSLGLIFVPFTAGASLALTAVGVGTGVASGVSSVATSVTKSRCWAIWKKLISRYGLFYITIAIYITIYHNKVSFQLFFEKFDKNIIAYFFSTLF